MKTVYKKPACLGVRKRNSFCPGCMHSIASRLVAEVLEEMDLVDNSVMIAGIGCGGNASFGYIDMDVGKAPHGRACALASAYKRCNPDELVFTYQGDGDLAAIGFAETMHAANRGENFSVIFINNALYGMTGGQLAPTTLEGMVTTTSPAGRGNNGEGYPMNVCELINCFKAPAYIARGTCTDPKNVRKTKEYIRKAFQNQLDGKGFSIVEIVSACPSDWHMSPKQCIDFINEKMLPEYPLGEFRSR
ncbi:MAG: 2-oxoglutarate oxidoreductase [Mogibacterium sp.]|nr:2-oxoglutarate oxidoreductase [Mogibacterium sp.]